MLHSIKIDDIIALYFCFFQKQDSAFTYEVIVVDDGSKDETSKVSHVAFRIVSNGKY